MRKLFFVFMFLFSTLFTTSVIGAGLYPDWVLPELKKYPIEKFIFDVGRVDGIGEEAFKEALAKASKKVSEKILRQVIGIINVNRDNVNYKTVREHYSAVFEDYCSWHLSSPALQLKGLEFDNLSLKEERKENETYAIVFIERIKLKQIYKNHSNNLKNEIKRHLKIAKAAEDDLNIDRAIKAYYQTYPLYESLKEAEIIQIGAEHRPNYHHTFTRLADSATKRHGNPASHSSVIKRVEELNNEMIVTFMDICRVVDSQLSMQLLPPNHTVAVHPIVYKDSAIISPFARQFTIALMEGMPEWVFVDPIIEFKQHTLNLDKINQDVPPLRLSSSCWENGDEVTIRVTLRNINTGEFLASTVVSFLKGNMRDNMTYLPRGYQEAQEEKDVFNPSYFVIEHTRGNDGDIIEHEFPPIGGLTVDLWTDKGRGPLSYMDGDKVKIFARVNQPAYLRLLNTHSDQKRVLLVDNFYIGPKGVNSEVKIGEFLCAPPIGVEFLNVAVRTGKFPKIETREDDGYHFLVEQEPEKAAAEFRGLKPIPKDDLNDKDKKFFGPKPIIDVQPDFQQSEAQLVITIMDK